MKLYKISASTANTLGIITYGENLVFNPFCLEQNDGGFIVNGDLIDELIANGTIAISNSLLNEITESEALQNAKPYGLHNI